MSQMPPPLPVCVNEPRRGNGLGIAGFIVSLVGLLSCGILSPIGALLSFVAMFRRPRGLAIAGLVIGLVGSIWAIVAFVLIGFATIGAALGIGALAPLVMTGVRMSQVAEAVAEHKNADGTFITDIDAVPGLSSEDRKDAWGHTLHIVVKGPSEFEIVSDGPDGIAGNSDDIHSNTSTDAPRPRHRPKNKRAVPAD